MKLERDVELYLRRKVEALGGLCVKAGQDGWPDRIVMLPDGTLTWVELKQESGELADLQIYRTYQLGLLGQRVVALWSKEDVDSFLRGK